MQDLDWMVCLLWNYGSIVSVFGSVSQIPIDQGNLIVMLKNIINLKGESMR